MTTDFNQMVGETVDLFEIQSAFNESSQDCAAARRAKVNCKKVLFHGILSIYLRYPFTYIAKVSDSLLVFLTLFD